MLATLDDRVKADLGREPSDESIARMVHFLLVLKCKLVPPEEEERTEWTRKLGEGDRAAVYPALHWVLSAYETLVKRAYLAPFLMPIDVPPEVAMQNDGTLTEAASRYRDLQAEFRECHKRYESARGRASQRPGAELKKEIAQLESERRQLRERIRALRDRTGGDDGFAAMLKVTGGMRKEQDEEIRLREKMQEQRESLDASERKLQQTQLRLRGLKASSVGGASGDSILGHVKREVEETTKIVRSDMVKEQRKLREKLSRLERERLEPAKTQDDVDSVRATVEQLEEQTEALKGKIASASGKDGNKKLSMFKQVRRQAKEPRLRI